MQCRLLYERRGRHANILERVQIIQMESHSPKYYDGQINLILAGTLAVASNFLGVTNLMGSLHTVI